MRWIIAVLLALVSTNLAAQPVEPRGYVFGGASASWGAGVTTDEYRTYLAAPGGWSGGWLAGGGVRVNRHVSLEGEWRRSGVMETVEPSRYFITYSAKRRDTRLAAGVRAHIPLSTRVTLEPLGLFEFVREASWLAQVRDVPGVPSPGSGSADDYAPFVNSWSRGLAGGMDLRLGGERLAFVPGVRVHRTFRGEAATSTWPGGRSTWGVDVTAGGRLDF